jgi:hypothetical protein
VAGDFLEIQQHGRDIDHHAACVEASLLFIVSIMQDPISV